jgi:XTP/dITP diphosphohydrolase|tara:strand:+ start:134 stop:766 length:633 start_codon:yes stop_codon:yes gene_type:complete
MNIVVATHNMDKCKEILSELSDLNVSLKTLKEYPEIGEIEETGTTLEENALIKVREVYAATGLPSMGDDTGLEVDALDGEPGVYSARFAGENCSYQDNVNKMLKEMQNVPDLERGAQFRTVVAYKDSKRELICEGIVKGNITTEIKGFGGFGYDPLFYIPEYKKTFAEMTMEEKSKISHRGIAIRGMVQLLKDSAIVPPKNTLSTREELA